MKSKNILVSHDVTLSLKKSAIEVLKLVENIPKIMSKTPITITWEETTNVDENGIPKVPHDTYINDAQKNEFSIWVEMLN